MSRPDFFPNPELEQERLQQGFLIGAAIGFAVLFLLRWHLLASVIFLFSFIHFIGWANYERVGRGIYIVLNALGQAVGRMITPVALTLMYVMAVLICGSILRLFGMNRLERNFAQCKEKDTMFYDAPATTRDDFGRQS